MREIGSKGEPPLVNLEEGSLSWVRVEERLPGSTASYTLLVGLLSPFLPGIACSRRQRPSFLKPAPVSVVKTLIFAEIELLRHLFAERVPKKFLVALRAQIIPKVFVGRLGKVWVLEVVFHFAQQLADRLHVVVFQVRLGDLTGIVGCEHFDLDHIAMVVPRAHLLAAKITRNV